MDSHQKLLQAIADVLNVDVASLDDKSGADKIPGWDSLAIVNLVAELEAAFQVEFDILEIAECRDVRAIKSMLMDKGVAF